MARRPVATLTAILPAVALVALLAGCATGEQEAAEPWTGRGFYPPEYCWRAYSGHADESAPGYWRMRHWCDQREMQGDWIN